MSAYSIENTTFGPIYRKITKDKKPIRAKYELILHTVKDDLEVNKFLSEDILRDYGSQVGTKGAVKFIVGLGTYVKKIYPFRDNLEVTIKRTILEEQGSKMEKETKVKVTRYKAIFLSDQNSSASAQGYERMKEDTLNNASIVTVTLEVTDRSLEPLRVITTSGIYRVKKYEDIIRGVLQKESDTVLVDGKPSVNGVDIVPPDNDQIVRQTLIPSGTKLTLVPTFLQEKGVGVYTAGIGTFLQTYKDNKLWFVYPLYNHSRFDQDVPKAIFYALPKGRHEQLDRTYIEDGKLLQVLLIADRNYTDQADLDNMNEGNGLRMSDATSYMHKPVEVTADGPKAKRTNLNTEVHYTNRTDGLNYAPVSSNRVSVNRYKEFSQVVARNTGTVTAVWENAEIDLIYPGMPCKYVIMGKDKPVELKGTILGVQALTSAEQDGLMTSAYKCSATIYMSVEPYEGDLDETTT